MAHEVGAGVAYAVGPWQVRTARARSSRNPKTGAAAAMPARRVIRGGVRRTLQQAVAEVGNPAHGAACQRQGAAQAQQPASGGRARDGATPWGKPRCEPARPATLPRCCLPLGAAAARAKPGLEGADGTQACRRAAPPARLVAVPAPSHNAGRLL